MRINKKEIIKKLYWDKNIENDYVMSLFDGKTNSSQEEDLIELYRRVLTSCDWSTITKLFPYEELKGRVLSETVINRIYPEDLRKKYRYARKILSDLIVPSAG